MRFFCCLFGIFGGVRVFFGGLGLFFFWPRLFPMSQIVLVPLAPSVTAGGAGIVEQLFGCCFVIRIKSTRGHPVPKDVEANSP